MIGTRVVSGLSLLAVLLGVLLIDEWFAPWFPLWFVLSLLAMGAAAFELVRLLGATDTRPSMNSVLGGVAALLVANWIPHLTSSLLAATHSVPLTYEPAEPTNVLSWPLLAFVGVLMVSFIVQSVQFVRPGRTMGTIAGTMLAVAYVGLLGSFIIQMRWLEGTYHGVMPLVFLFATAKGADTGAYTLGRLAGRHKLWPSLSPNKTIEGAIGGMVFAVGASLFVAALSKEILHVSSLTWPAAVGFGLLVGALAQLGDLMESMIKRDCQRKDASSAVPGFGGVLDVLDSLLFAAPVAYGYWVTLGP